MEELKRIEEPYVNIYVESPRFKILGISKDDMIKRFNYGLEHELKHVFWLSLFEKSADKKHIGTIRVRPETTPPFVYPPELASPAVTISDEMNTILNKRAKERFP